MAFDALKPNTAQTLGDVITSTRDNLNALDASRSTHEADSATAHGLAAVLATLAAYTAHAANETTAHGLASVLSDLADVLAEVAAGRGSQAALTTRLDVGLQASGALRLSSIASKWLNNGDTPSYVSTTSFSVPSDRTSVYLAGALLRFTIAGDYVYAPVASRSFGGGITTVVLDPAYAVLTAGVSAVDIALIAWDNAVAAATTQNAADVVDLQGQITGVATIGNMAGDPTGSELAAGKVRVWKNTTSGAVKLWANDSGTLKSVTLA